jgi:putative NADH-flavin reductase
MHVTVFGANGRVGQLVVGELLSRKHKVTAFVHNHSAFQTQPLLEIVKGDVGEPSTVHAAIQDADAVISVLSSWGTPSKDILATGMRTIIPAMQAAQAGRIISLTGAEAEASADGRSLIHRVAKISLGLVGGKVLKDGEEHIRLLEQSDLDWTVVRSPIMNERGPARYRLSDERPSPWQTINRHAVALSLVDLLTDEQYMKQAPYISRH